MPPQGFGTVIAAFVIIQEVGDGVLHRRGRVALREQVLLPLSAAGWFRGGGCGDGLLSPGLRLRVELGALSDGPCLGDMGGRLR